MHQRMIRVRQNNVAPEFMKALYLCCQLNMIFLVKLLFGIPFEVCIFGNRQVGRIKKNEVIFKVTNYGLLISEEESKKIYEKFYRTDSAKTMDPGGSGLGLYIAKAIIEGHGGKIWFISNEKEGTSFYFSLPLE